MMQGSVRYILAAHGSSTSVSQRRIAQALRQIDPTAYEARSRDLIERTNPIPYCSPYFGCKVHMDQNEKIPYVTHVHMIDGCSRFITGFITLPKKNPILIYECLYRPALIRYGLFDQLRVDHGSEFCLCIFVQELLKSKRGDRERLPWRKNYVSYKSSSRAIVA